MAFSVGQHVEWVSSGTKKFGEVIAVVPAGKTPGEVGHPKAGGGGIPRNHETYVIRGRKVNQRGPYGSKAEYWPHVSLIQARTQS